MQKYCKRKATHAAPSWKKQRDTNGDINEFPMDPVLDWFPKSVWYNLSWPQWSYLVLVDWRATSKRHISVALVKSCVVQESPVDRCRLLTSAFPPFSVFSWGGIKKHRGSEVPQTDWLLSQLDCLASHSSSVRSPLKRTLFLLSRCALVDPRMHLLGLKGVLLLYAAVCVSGMTREYFLRIEEVSWNYAPTGMNVIHNRTLDEDE